MAQKFFESACPSLADSQSWNTVVSNVSRDANAKAIRMKMLEQSCADLPSKGFHLHIWVHNFRFRQPPTLQESETEIELYVRVTLKENHSSIVSQFTRVVPAQTQGNAKSRDHAVHVWEEHMVHIFGHQLTVIVLFTFLGGPMAAI